MLTRLKETFGPTSRALGLGTILSFGAASTALANDEPTCAPLHETSTGRAVGASLSAHIYSKKNVGAVGISIYPGKDLGQRPPEFLGNLLVNTFRNNGVDADCFVHYEAGPRGTSVDFDVNGISWNGEGGLNISQSIDKKTLRGVIGEALMARSLASNKVDDQSVASTGPRDLSP